MRVALGRLACTILHGSLAHVTERVERPLYARIRRWFGLHSFTAHARLDFQTFSSTPLRRQLETTVDSYWGKTVVWQSLDLVTEIVGAVLQLVAHTAVLFNVLHAQRDGLLLASVALPGQVVVWMARTKMFETARGVSI